MPVLAGGGGEGLGFMKLAYDPATKTVTPVTAENGYRFLADQEGLVENQKVATALAPYNEELQAYLDQPLGTAAGAFSNENISANVNAAKVLHIQLVVLLILGVADAIVMPDHSTRSDLRARANAHPIYYGDMVTDDHSVRN